jgi:Tsi6
MSDQFLELQDALDVSRQMTAERVTNFPKFGPYKHVQDQIVYIEGFVRAKKIPTEVEKQKVDIGIMALKEFDSEDPDYAKSLMKLSRRFESLS